MNYSLHYNNLINRAKNRDVIGYTEKHHIIPRCMGGSNESVNIVRLTPEEHFLAHKLLVNIYPQNKNLLWAAVSMTNGTKKMARNNKLYGWLRREFSVYMSEVSKKRFYSEETRKKMSVSRTGKKRTPHSEETKLLMSSIAKGRVFTKEHIEKLSKAKIGKKRNPVSEETKLKIKNSNILSASKKDFSNRKESDYRKKQSDKMKEIWNKRKLINNLN
jgi:hypothetical protein